ncbi:hypothetical protein BD410DRAFT_215582 [Rickenella mellea]|uniref:Uncharacterized protein n=1 Tax=Rickenella mellea TaxID=50990 RepID=A0A4Y7QKZ0_9AGAM|nr:hypothetical protein BD410DRAFT_215582 [Rickenella mellea]
MLLRVATWLFRSPPIPTAHNQPTTTVTTRAHNRLENPTAPASPTSQISHFQGYFQSLDSTRSQRCAELYRSCSIPSTNPVVSSFRLDNHFNSFNLRGVRQRASNHNHFFHLSYMSDASVFVMSVHIAVRRRHLRARCASLRRSMQSVRTSSPDSLLLLRMIFGSCKARNLLVSYPNADALMTRCAQDLVCPKKETRKNAAERSHQRLGQSV